MNPSTTSEAESPTTEAVEAQARALSERFHSLQKLGLMTLLIGAVLVLSRSPLAQIVGGFSGAAGVVLTFLAFRAFRQLGKLKAPNS